MKKQQVKRAVAFVLAFLMAVSTFATSPVVLADEYEYEPQAEQEYSYTYDVEVLPKTDYTYDNEFQYTRDYEEKQEDDYKNEDEQRDKQPAVNELPPIVCDFVFSDFTVAQALTNPELDRVGAVIDFTGGVLPGTSDTPGTGPGTVDVYNFDTNYVLRVHPPTSGRNPNLWWTLPLNTGDWDVTYNNPDIVEFSFDMWVENLRPGENTFDVRFLDEDENTVFNVRNQNHGGGAGNNWDAPIKVGYINSAYTNFPWTNPRAIVAFNGDTGNNTVGAIPRLTHVSVVVTFNYVTNNVTLNVVSAIPAAGTGVYNYTGTLLIPAGTRIEYLRIGAQCSANWARQNNAPGDLEYTYGMRIDNISIAAGEYEGEAVTVYADEVILNHTSAALEVGPGAAAAAGQAVITATVNPPLANNQNVAWSVVSGNEYVTLVYEGNTVTITPVAEGTAIVRAAALGSQVPNTVYAQATITVEHKAAIEEPIPDFAALLPALDAGSLDDWDFLFGSNFALNEFFGFSTSQAIPANVIRNSIPEEVNETPWNHFMQFGVPNQGGRRYLITSLPETVEGQRAFITFDLRPGTVGGPAPAGGQGGNFADHSITLGGDPIFVIRNNPFAGGLFASGDIVRTGNYFSGNLDSAVALTSVTDIPGWQNTWFTFGIELNFISSEATVTVKQRTEFDTDAQNRTYGLVLGTYTVPFAGDSFDGFELRGQRDSGGNTTLTGHGIDNLYFFRGDIPADWAQVGDTIDFANGMAGNPLNGTVMFTQQFAGQTVLNANPHGAASNASNVHWTLPLNSGEWDIQDNNLVRIEFDIWTEWERQHTLGWEARFNSNSGVTAWDPNGTLVGVRVSSNGSHTPENPTFSPLTHVRMVTSESPAGNSGGANPDRNASPTEILFNSVPRHSQFRVKMEVNLVTQRGTVIVTDVANGQEVSRQNIALPTDGLESFSFGPMRQGGGNTWALGAANAWGIDIDTNSDFGAKINNISVFTANYGGVRPVIPPASITLSTNTVALETGPGALPPARTANVTANVLPVNADDRTFTWSVTPGGIADIVTNEDGSVTINSVAEGNAVLTATTNMAGANGYPLTATVDITVEYVAAEAEPMPCFEWLLDLGYEPEFGTNFDLAITPPYWRFTAGAPRVAGNGEWSWIAREEYPVTNHYFRYETQGQSGGRNRHASLPHALEGSSVHVNFDWRMPSSNIGGYRNSVRLSLEGAGVALVTLRAGVAQASRGLPTGWRMALTPGPE